MRFTTIITTTATLLLLGAILFSCEDPIEVPSDFEEPQLVVDAWLENTNTPQTIILSETVDYFAGGQPNTITTATIQVCKNDGATCYDFVHTSDGRYVWQPAADETLGSVGDNFALSIELDDVIYTGQALLRRTTRLDSIGFVFEEETILFEEGFAAEAYAFDLPGRGDTYWMKTYKNDTLLNRASELTIAFDATFDAGADVDGTYFIPPLRRGANPFDDDGAFIPYQLGDRVRVEVHSISQEAFQFLSIATEQILNEGLFAVPLANSPSNIVNTTTGERILGIFNVAEVATLERKLE
ncbi:MAG: DUF4249 domain-containing protein [Bacteroidota bacterium]